MALSRFPIGRSFGSFFLLVVLLGIETSPALAQPCELCVPCSEVMGGGGDSSGSGEEEDQCLVCDPVDPCSGGFEAWFDRTKQCYPPGVWVEWIAKPENRARLLCVYHRRCGGECGEIFYWYEQAFGELSWHDKYIISQMCQCEFKEPPPPPGWGDPIVLPIYPPIGDTQPPPPPFGDVDFRQNPFEPSWGGGGAINLQSGSYSPLEVDLVLPAAGPDWVIGRVYNGAQTHTGVHHDSNTSQGYNWMQVSQPFITLRTFSDASLDLVQLVYGASPGAYASFQRVSSSTFKGYGATAGAVVKTTVSGREVYEVTDTTGVVMSFFGFDAWASNLSIAGKLWKITTPGVATPLYLGHASDPTSAASAGYTSDGEPAAAFDASGRRFLYAYSASDIGGVKRLLSVTAQIQGTSGWSTPVQVGRVEYVYYTSDEAGVGLAGDLKMVRTITPGNGADASAGTVTRRRYYRYYTTSWSSTTPGSAHQLLLALEPEGARRMDLADGGGLDESLVSASEAAFVPYTSAWFTYHADYRIAAAWMEETGCGCSGLTGGRTYAYETNTALAPGAYSPVWATRTTVRLPDGSAEVAYFDPWNQMLASVTIAGDPAATPTPASWVTQLIRDEHGRVVEERTPAAISGYDHASAAITARAGQGLVTLYERLPHDHASYPGFITHTRWREGTSTGQGPYLQSSVGYTGPSMTVGDAAVLRALIASRGVYEAKTNDTQQAITTTAGYTYHAGAAALRTAVTTTTLPAVATATNGSGQAAQASSYTRPDGTTAFTKSLCENAPDGYLIGYTAYDANGQIAKRIVDCDTGVTGAFGSESVPAGFASSSVGGSPKHLVTTFAYDPQGRAVGSVAPDGLAGYVHRTALADGRAVVLAGPRREGSLFFGPASYSVANQAGLTEASALIALPEEGAGDPSGWSSESSSDPIAALSVAPLKSLATALASGTGAHVTEDRAYFTIPASGAGVEGTHYDATRYAYDAMGRTVRVKDATGTIDRSVFDMLGREVESWTGTNDHGWDQGEATGSANMVKVSSAVYDGGSVGNGNLTSGTLYPGAGQPAITTTSAFDARGNLVLSKGPLPPYALTAYDNLGRVTASALYGSDQSLAATSDPLTLTAGRLALARAFYDARGRVWKSQSHKIDPDSGADQDSLQTLAWYDPRGRLAKVDGAQLEKFVYDRLGRIVRSYVLGGDNDGTTYANMLGVDGDQVIEEHHSGYLEDSGLAVLSASIQRRSGDYGAGETTGALDLDADGDGLTYAAADLRGRISISAMWADALGRPTHMTAFGTYGLESGSGTFNRRSMTAAPATSATALTTQIAYGPDGHAASVTDPRGLVSSWQRDDALRTIAAIANFKDGVPGNQGGDDDQITRYAYASGLPVSFTLDMPGADDQVTTYTYGVSPSDSPVGSGLASNRMLRSVVFPPQTGGQSAADRTASYAYNALGQGTWTKDQDGTVTQRTYDTAGRTLYIRFTELGSGVDGAVRRLGLAYDSLGRASALTQHGTAEIPGQGQAETSVLDQLAYAYDGWGNLASFTQDVDSAIGAGTGRAEHAVSYSYAKSTTGRNALRVNQQTLPGGFTLSYGYTSLEGSLGGDSKLSRVTTVKNGSTTLAQYSYMGLSTIAGITLPATNASWSIGNAAGTDESNLDRFGRLASDRWQRKVSNSPLAFIDVHREDLAYDLNGNIARVLTPTMGGQDRAYTHDGLDRLTGYAAGTWSTQSQSITQSSASQIWDLSLAGNRTSTTRYGAGGVFIAGEGGSFNSVNELAGSWADTTGDGLPDVSYTSTHSRSGGMLDDGKDFTYTYDALNRLVKVSARGSGTQVAQHRYNALGHRIATRAGASDPWTYTAFDPSWRPVATFSGSSTTPSERFLYHNAGLDGYGMGHQLDDLIARDRDADGQNGTLEERLFYLNNWHGDVVALLSGSSGNAQQVERVRYSPYGVPFGLPAGDVNNDGLVNSADVTAVTAMAGQGGTYGLSGDMNLDGVVDSSDVGVVTARASQGGLSAGQGVLSTVGNRLGYASYQWGQSTQRYSVRHRVYNPHDGRWLTRDPLGYADGLNLYQYVHAMPAALIDPMGTQSLTVLGQVAAPPVAPPAVTPSPVWVPPGTIGPGLPPLAPTPHNPQVENPGGPDWVRDINRDILRRTREDGERRRIEWENEQVRKKKEREKQREKERKKKEGLPEKDPPLDPETLRRILHPFDIPPLKFIPDPKDDIAFPSKYPRPMKGDFPSQEDCVAWCGANYIQEVLDCNDAADRDVAICKRARDLAIKNGTPADTVEYNYNRCLIRSRNNHRVCTSKAKERHEQCTLECEKFPSQSPLKGGSSIAHH